MWLLARDMQTAITSHGCFAAMAFTGRAHFSWPQFARTGGQFHAGVLIAFGRLLPAPRSASFGGAYAIALPWESSLCGTWDGISWPLWAVAKAPLTAHHWLSNPKRAV